MFRSTAVKVAAVIVLGLLLGFFDLPPRFKSASWLPDSVRDATVHLGLDLQGGSQLDYVLDLRKVPEKDKKQITEGVLAVINRRVNGLGVSEPNIYTSSVGSEQHLIVELAGVKDLEEAKAVVGKTIQLEFKEKREKPDPNAKEAVRAQALEVLKKISGENFDSIADQEVKANPGKAQFDEGEWVFAEDIKEAPVAAALAGLKEGEHAKKIIDVDEGKGLAILKLAGKRDTAALDAGAREVKVSHILVAYKGSERAEESITRTKEEALARANELLAQAKKGVAFEKLAKESSDDTVSGADGGKLSGGVKIGGGYVDAFTDAALKLTKKGALSDAVESPFGYHIIRADNFSQIKFAALYFSTIDDPWIATGLTGQHFKRAEVTFSNLNQPTVSIEFNDEGAKLFEEITQRNVNKPVAIFVGGQLISAPNVNEKITGGSAVISGSFTPDEAEELKRDLNTGAIPAPVSLTGVYTIGASLGQQALDTSLRAGLIGLIILAVFMIAYYRLPGLVATVALGMYSAILLFFVKSELPMGISLFLGIIIFAAIVYKVLQSREGGWEKFIGFVLACFVLFFATFLFSKPIVLTLAGVAGVILSIGMAVDANILIFERMKEELRAGRPLSSAIEVGFDRAWSSIRDSNFSSLITCAILFYFGTSIIQGFAFNLAAGILISMFSAITITRTLLLALMKTPLGNSLLLWGSGVTAEVEKKTYHIVEKKRAFFSFSGAVIAASIIAAVTLGLRLGIDFQGGTRMDIGLKNDVTVDAVKQELLALQNELNSKTIAPAASPAGPQLQKGDAVDFESARVLSAGQKDGQYHILINLPHIDNETHDKIIGRFQEKFGELTESQFTTIGPTVGETLKRRAVVAVLLAMLAIVLYIAFAFRKVPKRVSAWKLGACAIVALLHDVLIPVGVFSLFQFEIDALFITAILTVLGFSVHDTIVVFDRIRENLKYAARDESFAATVNKSLSQTMARSINTSLTTLITLTALLLLGSPSIFNFILVLVIGIVVGTYSSIFIASPLLVWWQRRSELAK